MSCFFTLRFLFVLGLQRDRERATWDQRTRLTVGTGRFVGAVQKVTNVELNVNDIIAF
jgi:hypothetical protein